MQEVQTEGKYAIDSPGYATAPVIPPEEYNLGNKLKVIVFHMFKA